LAVPQEMSYFSTTVARTSLEVKAALLCTTLRRAAPPVWRCSWTRYPNGTLSERDKLIRMELGLIRFF